MKNFLRTFGMFAMALFLFCSTEAFAFTLTPTCAPVCGASQLVSTIWPKPVNATREEQYVEVTVSANTLWQNSQEHVAISAFAIDQPFKPDGSYTTNASGGGIGLAMGTLSYAYHPACIGSSSSNVQFAIETFGLGDPYSSNIVACKNIAKTTLNGISSVRIGLYAVCRATSCEAFITLKNAATNATILAMSAQNMPLANTSSTRRVWYAVTKTQAQSYGATFTPTTEYYASYLNN